eukprot:IDg15715t1
MSAPTPVLAPPQGESAARPATEVQPGTAPSSAGNNEPAATPAPPAPPMSHRERHAEARLHAEAWDVEAWLILMQEAGHKPFAVADALYKRLVVRFPPSARFWLARAE